MDKFVFRNIEDAPAYDVPNCENGAGTIFNVTLFGDEAKMPVVGPRNPEATNNFHYVHKTTLPVGGSVGEHPHEGNEQFYLIVEGEGEVTLCGNTFPVKPWSIALIRSGGSHGIRNTGTTPLTYLCVETGLTGQRERAGKTMRLGTKQAAGAGANHSLKNFAMQYAIYLVLAMMILTIVALDPSILTLRNLTFILQQAAPKLIIALGVAGLIILGGTDLSAGRMVGMAGVICASLLQQPDYALRIFPNLPQLPIWVPLLIAVAVCLFFSLMHGLLVSVFQIAPFIASLGMQMVVYGAMSLYFDGVNNSSPIGGHDVRFASFAQSSLYIGSFRLPYIVIYAAIITLLFWIFWNRTTLGRNMYAVGGNKEAAIVSGVNTKKVMILVYLIAGLTYAFAGFLDAGRTGSATNGLGDGYELDAIASCVVGGVSMRGGIGKISGVVTGVLIFQVLSYCLVYMNINTYIQYIVKGLIIIFAIVVDTQKYIKKR